MELVNWGMVTTWPNWLAAAAIWSFLLIAIYVISGMRVPLPGGITY